MSITNNTLNVTQRQEDFIMLPTNDVCFAGLMENPTVRKGFCAAVMRVHPDEIGKTELLPTHLQRENADDKLGILDVRVRMKNGTQINMEMQVKGYEKPGWKVTARSKNFIVPIIQCFLPNRITDALYTGIPPLFRMKKAKPVSGSTITADAGSSR